MCIALISTAHPSYSLIIIDNRDVRPDQTHTETRPNTDKIGIPPSPNIHRRLVALATLQHSRIPRPRQTPLRHLDGHHQTRQSSRAHQLPRRTTPTSRGSSEPWSDCEQLVDLPVPLWYRSRTAAQTVDSRIRRRCDTEYHGYQGRGVQSGLWICE